MIKNLRNNTGIILKLKEGKMIIQIIISMLKSLICDVYLATKISNNEKYNVTKVGNQMLAHYRCREMLEKGYVAFNPVDIVVNNWTDDDYLNLERKVLKILKWKNGEFVYAKEDLEISSGVNKELQWWRKFGGVDTELSEMKRKGIKWLIYKVYYELTWNNRIMKAKVDKDNGCCK